MDDTTDSGMKNEIFRKRKSISQQTLSSWDAWSRRVEIRRKKNQEEKLKYQPTLSSLEALSRRVEIRRQKNQEEQLKYQDKAGCSGSCSNSGEASEAGSSTSQPCLSSWDAWSRKVEIRRQKKRKEKQVNQDRTEYPCSFVHHTGRNGFDSSSFNETCFDDNGEHTGACSSIERIRSWIKTQESSKLYEVLENASEVVCFLNLESNHANVSMESKAIKNEECEKSLNDDGSNMAAVREWMGTWEANMLTQLLKKTSEAIYFLTNNPEIYEDQESMVEEKVIKNGEREQSLDEGGSNIEVVRHWMKDVETNMLTQLLENSSALLEFVANNPGIYDDHESMFKQELSEQNSVIKSEISVEDEQTETKDSAVFSKAKTPVYGLYESSDEDFFKKLYSNNVETPISKRMQDDGDNEVQYLYTLTWDEQFKKEEMIATANSIIQNCTN